MNDKRSFLRIPSHLACRMRIMQPGERPIYHSDARSQSVLDPLTLKNSGLPEAVQVFLLRLDSKLEQLLMQSSTDRMQDLFPLSGTISEISAAGIKFTVPSHSFEVGQEVEVIILLSQLPLRMAGALGKVVRVDNCEAPGCYALDFTEISDSDQEAVVQYVLREQRAQIREQKGY